MVIYFTKIKSGQDFEDLCADLLEAERFKIRHSGVGPDRGMDIIAQKDIDYGVGNPERFSWLVQSLTLPILGNKSQNTELSNLLLPIEHCP